MPTADRPLPSPPKRRRERLGPFLLLILACALVVGALTWPELQGARRIVARETAACDLLLQLADLERTLHERTGRYGFLSALTAAGLLDEKDLVETDGTTWVRASGYRIDVLLPSANLGSGVVGIVPEGSSQPVDAELATRHFAVVARPLEPAVSGFRAWYVDERGELYLNEGVIDDIAAARNDLPTVQVLENASLDTADLLLWQKASEVPPHDD